MSRATAVLVTALLMASLSSRPAAADRAADRERPIRLLLIGGSILIYASSELFVKDALSPDECVWCDGNAFDDAARDRMVWRDVEAANSLSNLTGFVLAPLTGGALLLLASSDRTQDRWGTYVDDLIPVLEGVMYTQLVTNVVKYSFGRQRPFVRFANEEVDPHADHNLSFFSGHSALTFGIAFGAGQVAHRRGYRLEPVIWGAGISLAVTTALLRIAADRHYATDVLAGSAMGIAGALLIPRLTGSLPRGMTIAPRADGVALVGTF